MQDDIEVNIEQLDGLGQLKKNMVRGGKSVFWQVQRQLQQFRIKKREAELHDAPLSSFKEKCSSLW